MSIRIVTADARPSMLGLLERLCLRHRSFEVVARVTTGTLALHAVKRFRPDVLLLDSRIAGPDALVVLQRMQRRSSRTRTIVLIEAGEDGINALRLGARSVIFKVAVPKLLAECIREVHAGRKWLELDHSVSILEKLVAQPTSTREISELLTPREVDVARMVGQGLDASALASELAITRGTAKGHLQRIYGKLNVRGHAELEKLVQAVGLR